MLTIPTDAPWVPLRILSLGLEGEEVVEADVFLLTDEEPDLLAGGPGLSLDRSEPADDLLLDDLRSDVGMEWVPQDMWFSYLQVEADAADLDYDLAISPDETTLPTLEDTGVPAPEVRPVNAPGPALPVWPMAAGAVVAVILAAAFLRTRRLAARRRREARSPPRARRPAPVSSWPARATRWRRPGPSTTPWGRAS